MSVKYKYRELYASYSRIYILTIMEISPFLIRSLLDAFAHLMWTKCVSIHLTIGIDIAYFGSLFFPQFLFIWFIYIYVPSLFKSRFSRQFYSVTRATQTHTQSFNRFIGSISFCCSIAFFECDSFRFEFTPFILVCYFCCRLLSSSSP